MRSVLATLVLVLTVGLLSGCGQAQLKELTPSSNRTGPDYSFKTGVRNALATGLCGQTSCHSAETRSGGLNLDPTQTCEQMYQSLLNGGTQQQQGNGKDVDTADPANSLVLTKPAFTSTPKHNGGFVPDFAEGTPDYETVLHWIQNGALDDCGS